MIQHQVFRAGFDQPPIGCSSSLEENPDPVSDIFTSMHTIVDALVQVVAFVQVGLCLDSCSRPGYFLVFPVVRSGRLSLGCLGCLRQ